MFFNINGQQSQYHFLDYKWQNGAVTVNDSKSHYLSFEFQTTDYLSKTDIRVINPVYTLCDSSEINYIKNFLIDSIPKLSYQSGIRRKQLIVRGEVFPYILKDDLYQKLIFVELQLSSAPSSFSTRKSNATVEHSVLSNGNWYKFALNTDGIYRLTYQDLQNLGMNVSNLNPQNLRIYGHPGGLLPTENFSTRTVDLQELAIQVIGQSDGSFDENDYILFFGQSPNQWVLNSSGFFSHQQHYYDDNTYYFITADIGEGRRVESFQSLSSADNIINTFNDYQIHEKEEQACRDNEAQNLAKSAESVCESKNSCHRFERVDAFWTA